MKALPAKLLVQARHHYERKEYVAARELCAGILAGQPTHAAALYLRALCDLFSGRPQAVVDGLSVLVAHHPEHVNGRLLLARACLQIGDHRGSVAHARRVLDLDVRDDRALGLLADILGRSEDHDGARIAYEKAMRLNPRSASHLCNYASVLRIQGRTDEAARALEECLALDPAHCKAHWMLSSLKRQTAADNHVHRLESVRARSDLTDDGRMLIDFALSREYEDLGEDEKSFEHLARACELKRRSFEFDVAGDTQALRQLEELFTPRYVDEMSGSGCTDHTPMFIVGLPRTGSTLIEQILAASGRLFPAGELPTFGNEVARLCGRPIDYRALGSAYVERSVALIESGKGRGRFDGSVPFIDKMPQNLAWVGYICLALPRAKIVLTLRNAMDTCLSNFRELYRDPHYRFSYRLDEMGAYYVASHRLWRHWMRLFGSRIHTVQYEHLVAAPETVAEGLYAYCGVPWRREYLDASRRRGPVATASATQVREAVNADSVDRWKRFERQLAPLRAQLSEAGVVI